MENLTDSEYIPVLKELVQCLIKIFENEKVITSENYKLPNSKIVVGNGALFIKNKDNFNLIGIVDEEDISEDLLDINDPSCYEVIVRRNSFFICSHQRCTYNKVFTDFGNKIEIFDIPNSYTWEENAFQLSLVVPDSKVMDVLSLYKELYGSVLKHFYLSFETETYSTESLKLVLKDVKKFIKDYIK